jgi:hypothetical protein
MKQFEQPRGIALAAVATLCMAAPAHAQLAARDAETGRLRAPTAAEAQALTGGAAPATTRGKAAEPAARIGMITGKVNPAPIYHANGSVEQELDASTMSYTVVRRNPDGTLSMECVTGEDAAKKALMSKAPGAKVIGKSAAKEHQHEVK